MFFRKYAVLEQEAGMVRVKKYQDAVAFCGVVCLYSGTLERAKPCTIVFASEVKTSNSWNFLRCYVCARTNSLYCQVSMWSVILGARRLHLEELSYGTS